MNRVADIVLHGYIWLLAGLILFSYPLGLIPASVRLDSPVVRIGMIMAGVVLASGAWMFRQLSTRRYVVISGSGLLLLFAGLFLPPGLNGSANYLVLPAAYLAGTWGVVCLALVSFRLPRWWWPLALIFLVAVGWQPLRPRIDAFSAVEMLALVAAPLAVASVMRWRPTLVRMVVAALALFWLLSLVKGMDQWIRGQEVIGFAMNRNWFATALLATAPWVPHALREWCSMSIQSWRWRVSAAAVSVMTLLLVYQCESRAAWLALICYGLLLLFWKWSRSRQRLILGATLLLAVFAAVILFRAEVGTAMERDIRLPLWKGTLRLIADQPAMGVGPGRYVEEQILRLDESYHRRLMAAPLVSHPHNELLHVAAAAGVVPALAWLLLMVSVLRRFPSEDDSVHLARFGAFVLLLHGMLDMVLVQPPGSIVAFVLIGMVWMPRTGAVVFPARWMRALPGRVLVGLLIAGALVWSVAETSRQLGWGWHFRRGHQYLQIQDLSTALTHFRTSTRIQPERVAGWYAKATVEIRNQQAEQALESLDQVVQLNRNYAHVHRLRGNTLLRLGQAEDAMEAYRSDLALHPNSLATLLNYYTAAFAANRAGQAGAIAGHVRAVSGGWLRQLHGERGERLREEWQAAVSGGDVARAVDLANRLTDHPNLRLQMADPLLYTTAVGGEFPGNYVHGTYAAADVAGWRAHRLRAEVIGSAGASVESVGQLVRHFASQVAVAPEANVALPEEVWLEAKGQLRDIHASLAWLMNGIEGVQALTYCPEAKTEEWAVYALLPSHLLLRCDPKNGIVKAVSSSDVPADFGMVARLVIHPADFFMRNQILYIALGSFGAGDHWLRKEWPLVRTIETLQRFAALAKPINVQARLDEASLIEFNRRLQQRPAE